MVYSLGAVEKGSDPFFFPKFPVHSTVSLYVTMADMVGNPGVRILLLRNLSTCKEGQMSRLFCWCWSVTFIARSGTEN